MAYLNVNNTYYYSTAIFPNKEEIILVKAGRWVEALSMFRRRNNLGLLEAKTIIDELRAKYDVNDDCLDCGAKGNNPCKNECPNRL